MKFELRMRVGERGFLSRVDPHAHVCSSRGRVNSRKSERERKKGGKRASRGDGCRLFFCAVCLSSKEEQRERLLSVLVFACVLFLPDLLFTFSPSSSSHLQTRRPRRRYYCFCCSSCRKNNVVDGRRYSKKSACNSHPLRVLFPRP